MQNANNLNKKEINCHSCLKYVLQSLLKLHVFLPFEGNSFTFKSVKRVFSDCASEMVIIIPQSRLESVFNAAGSRHACKIAVYGFHAIHCNSVAADLMVYVISNVCSCFNTSQGSLWSLISVTATQ